MNQYTRHLSVDIITKTDNLTIKANNVDVGKINVFGRATAPTTVNIDLAGFKVEVKSILDNLVSTNDDKILYSPTNDEIDAKFQQEFSNFMPGAYNPSDPFQVAHLLSFLNDKANQLQEKVRIDFENVNKDGINAISFVSTPATVDLDWSYTISPVDALGSADFDVNDHDGSHHAFGTDRHEDTLRQYLANPSIGLAAKEWALAESLNPSVSDHGKIAVGAAALVNWEAPNTSFIDIVSNIVSHELAHTFGINDAYLITQGTVQIIVDPDDLMRAASITDMNLRFDARNINLLRASMGLAEDDDLPLTLELEMYARNINLPFSQVGIDLTGGSMPSPQPGRPIQRVDTAVADKPVVEASLSGTPGIDISDVGAVATVGNSGPVLTAASAYQAELITSEAVVESVMVPSALSESPLLVSGLTNGQGMLTESTLDQSRILQSLTLPSNASTLHFELPSIHLMAGLGVPPDAFEVALLDAQTKASLVGTARGLTLTDALLNIQSDGHVYFGQGVRVLGAVSSGDVISLSAPIVVDVDLTGIETGRSANLYFDLLGFGAADSSVAIDNVEVVTEGTQPFIARDDTAETDEDSSVVINVVANDTDDNGIIDPTTVTITAPPSNGSVQVNSVTGAVTYTPANNFFGADSFRYTVHDNVGLISNEAQVQVQVAAVNDAPTGTDTTVTTLEDTAYTFTAADFGFHDPADSPAHVLTAVQITTLATDGVLTLGGLPVAVNQVIPVANLTAGDFKFSPDLNAHGSSYATFTFQVQDNGGTGNGGVDLDPTPQTMTVTVTPVNDAPVALNESFTTHEDTPLTVTAPGVLGNDTDIDNVSLNVVLVTPVQHGTLTLNGNGSFTYTPAANYNGSDSFTYKANDGQADSTVATVSLTMTPVNDAPVGTATTVTILEDTAYTFTVADFGFTDPHDSPANTLLAVQITSVPTAGVLMNNGSTVTAGQVISVGDLSTGTLVFTPAPNANGLSYATFTFQVQDDGGATNGGVDLDPTPKTLTLNVTPVNDAPVGTDTTVITLEDTVYTFTVADFGFHDPADSPAHALTAVQITTLATDGVLTLGGLPVAINQGIPVARLTAGDFKFSPDLNEHGAFYATFTFQVQDNGGTANGGVDLDPTPQTMTVTVTPVNDAPVLDAITAPSPVQYSDPITSVLVTASDVDTSGTALIPSFSYRSNGGNALAGLPSGLSAAIDTTAVGLPGQRTWTISGTANVAPGTYTITAQVSDGSLDSPQQSFVLAVNREDADVTYTGQTFVNTASPTANTAVVPLEAVIRDITAVPASGDLSAGAILNAAVTFKVYDAFSNALLATITNPTVGLISSDPRIALAQASFTANLGNASAATYRVRTLVGGSYIADAIEDDSLITVAKPVDFTINGGGYVMVSTSAGSFKADAASKVNFGLNIGYNKNLTNVQGKVTAIFRRTQADGVHTYQIRSNASGTLSVDPTTGVATFTAKANLTDVTNEASPVTIGNYDLLLRVDDNGEPGTGSNTKGNDQFALRLLHGTTLIFATRWDGTQAQFQTLDGGNIQVRPYHEMLLKVNDVTVTESNAGTTNATFTASLNAASTKPVSFTYATANDTATAGSDYIAASGTASIPAGQTSATITVTVHGDIVDEPDEVFFLNLLTATHAGLQDPTGVGSIVDDDPAPPLRPADAAVTPSGEARASTTEQARSVLPAAMATWQAAGLDAARMAQAEPGTMVGDASAGAPLSAALVFDPVTGALGSRPAPRSPAAAPQEAPETPRARGRIAWDTPAAVASPVERACSTRGTWWSRVQRVWRRDEPAEVAALAVGMGQTDRLAADETSPAPRIDWHQTLAGPKGRNLRK